MDPSEPFAEALRERLPTPTSGSPRRRRPSPTGHSTRFSPSSSSTSWPTRRLASRRCAGSLVRWPRVAACVWDYPGEMTLLRVFWDAAESLDPESVREVDERADAVWRSGRARRALAGLRLGRSRTANSSSPPSTSEDLWEPFTGVGPAGALRRLPRPGTAGGPEERVQTPPRRARRPLRAERARVFAVGRSSVRPGAARHRFCPAITAREPPSPRQGRPWLPGRVRTRRCSRRRGQQCLTGHWRARFSSAGRARLRLEALAVFEGETLAERAYRIAHSSVRAGHRRGQGEGRARAPVPGARRRQRDSGAIVGVAAALRLADADRVVVLPTDMPFVTAELLLALAEASRSAKAAVPHTGPLPGPTSVRRFPCWNDASRQATSLSTARASSWSRACSGGTRRRSRT